MTSIANRLPFSFSTDAAGAFPLLDGDASMLNRHPELSTCPADLDEVEVWAEGLRVVRVRRVAIDAPWEVAAIACPGATHGVHPKFAALTERVATLRERVLGPTPPIPCQRCDGSGWIAFDSVEGRRWRSVARAFGMWRGIVDPAPRPPTSEESLLALDVFLGESTLAGLRGAMRPTGGDDGD